MYPLKDRTFHVIVQGCRTNQYEGEAIASLLEDAGASHSEKEPDVVVFVTCTITAVADRKCRKQIRRLRREYPGSLLAVCGCYAQKTEDSERVELGADLYIGNRRKFRIVPLLTEAFSEKNKKILTEIAPDLHGDVSWDKLTMDRPRLHSRAFLKVQDGCNHYCSYCIVPFVRGNPVSRDLEEAVEEAEKIVGSGCPEIVLTGIHLGLYEKLPELVRRIDSLPGLKRLRFGSIEPFAVNDALLDTLAETRTLCPHLHLPLQSGDDGVLKNMRRGYTTAEFAKIAERARQRLGASLHLSTDLMVAFPGEDEKAFANSLRFLREIGFGKVHVFPYSRREGTQAASLEQIPVKEAQERVQRALALGAQLHQQYGSRWLDQEVSVLVEKTEHGVIQGLTPHFMRVIGYAPSAHIGEEVCIVPRKYENEALLTDDLGERVNLSDHIADFL